jgi:hypothetical protein
MTRFPARSALNVIFPLLVISIFSIVSFAAAVAVNSTTYQGQNGVYFNIAGGFTAASNGFNVIQATASASGQPCAWSNGATCQTALAAGDWEYSATLTMTASAAVTHTYTLTVAWNTGSGYVTLGTLTVTSPATIVAGQTMTFLINTGGTSFTAPAGIVVTVA